MRHKTTQTIRDHGQFHILYFWDFAKVTSFVLFEALQGFLRCLLDVSLTGTLKKFLISGCWGWGEKKLANLKKSQNWGVGLVAQQWFGREFPFTFLQTGTGPGADDSRGSAWKARRHTSHRHSGANRMHSGLRDRPKERSDSTQTVRGGPLCNHRTLQKKKEKT